jgi:hypothetical protein
MVDGHQGVHFSYSGDDAFRRDTIGTFRPLSQTWILTRQEGSAKPHRENLAALRRGSGDEHAGNTDCTDPRRPPGIPASRASRRAKCRLWREQRSDLL